MLFGIGVSSRNLYSILRYLYVSCSGSLPKLGKRELTCLLSFTCNYVVSVLKGIPLPLSACDGLRYLIVALPEPSI